MFAWAGAALFVISLSYFAYSFLITYAAPAAATARGAVAVDLTLFTVFALHHSVFARERVRESIARLAPGGRERSVYVSVASLLFIAVCALWRPVAGVLWDVGGVALAGLWMLQLFGVYLTIRSAAIIDVWQLSGVAPAAAAAAPGHGEFKTTGPYGWVRHPIYSGWFLLVFATSPMTGTRVVFAAVSSLYLLLAIPFEERSLRATTAGAYERYMDRVRWKLVPGVY